MTCSYDPILLELAASYYVRPLHRVLTPDAIGRMPGPDYEIETPEHPLASCWIWNKAVWKGTNGPAYGTTKNMASNPKYAWKASRPAHRVYYELFFGPIDCITLDCHHKCGNVLCVNPFHIWLLTRTEHKLLHEENEVPVRFVRLEDVPF